MGLDHETSLHKMRLLTLVTLAMGKTEIEYATVASGLNIEVDDVEDWIIEAIGEDLLEGKLDQINDRVLIRYVCMYVCMYNWYKNSAIELLTLSTSLPFTNVIIWAMCLISFCMICL